MDIKHTFTILIVDDNVVNLKFMEKILQKEGYRVITTNNGTDARTLAMEKRPDLILLDIQMPGGDGFEVIRFLKGTPITSTIPVIFLTGMTDVNSKLKGFELGAVDYVTKPFHPLEVLARVAIHLKLSIATNSLIANQAMRLKEITEAQTSMLPLPKDFPQAKFGVYYSALHEAGGDFYDVLSISDKITGYFVADFSGHDIKSSYMTASIKALLAQNSNPIYSPLETMKMINDVLMEILSKNKYLTACYARLNRTTGNLCIVSAGHPPVVLVPVTGDPQLIQVDGDVLGMFKDAKFGVHRMRLNPGDRFFIYSDGLVESTRQKITWNTGAQTLLTKFKKIRNLPLSKTSSALVKNLFPGGAVPEDDIVVLCVEV